MQALVLALKRRAAAQGISAEEGHRRLLAKALGGEEEAWGELNVLLPLPVLDGRLAATARRHGLVLATRRFAGALGLARAEIPEFDAESPVESVSIGGIGEGDDLGAAVFRRHQARRDHGAGCGVEAVDFSPAAAGQG